MNWGRKGIALTLAVVAIWATPAASACLLGMGHPSQPDCCRAMAQNCPAPAMGMSSSCCQVQGTSPGITPVLPFPVGHSLKLAASAHQAGFELPAATGVSYRNAVDTPPKFPPGGAFALRI